MKEMYYQDGYFEEIDRQIKDQRFDRFLTYPIFQ